MADEEYVSIDGLDIRLPWASVGNLWELWSGPHSRGSDVEIPGAQGVISYPRRTTVTPRTLEIEVFGDFDTGGDPVDDARVGLLENLTALRALTDPLETGDGTRTLTLHLPDGDTVDGAIHCERLEVAGDGPFAARCVLDITIPAGALS